MGEGHSGRWQDKSTATDTLHPLPRAERKELLSVAGLEINSRSINKYYATAGFQACGEHQLFKFNPFREKEAKAHSYWSTVLPRALTRAEPRTLDSRLFTRPQ